MTHLPFFSQKNPNRRTRRLGSNASGEGPSLAPSGSSSSYSARREEGVIDPRQGKKNREEKMRGKKGAGSFFHGKKDPAPFFPS
jgi:hypothetical protein